jgi:sigma-B regulation protein RsbU (phosphoserine phosphatase)
VRSDWRFLTSSSLGGDSFGYHWLPALGGRPAKLAIYLLDVCGHGVGAALLSVSAINTLRNGTLPATDFASPAQVLTGLNKAFPMEEQSGKYFTMFYAIFDTATRELKWASGGHPPAIALSPEGHAQPLSATGMIIGAVSFARYTERSVTLPAGSQLFVFSDGCYEVFNPALDSETPHGAAPHSPTRRQMTLDEFTQILRAAAPHEDALDRVIAASRAWQARPDFEDDFSLLQFWL